MAFSQHQTITTADARGCAPSGEPAMSYQAIAAALALEDVSPGERLVAFVLASFANRQQQAWPGTSLAATRAGLSRSQFLAARNGLARRGLVSIGDTGGGRGNTPLVTLHFAVSGPSVEAEVNAPLFEAVLSYSRARGSARLLLAALAAFADDARVVDRVATEGLCAAAGLPDRTYCRARAELLGTGEVVARYTTSTDATHWRWRVATDTPRLGAREVSGLRLS